jgi:uncharacterized membrane protein
METIEKSIEVEAPISTVYNQWTQFEEYPHFMEAVEEVKQMDDKRLHWRATVGGKEKEWDAEIFEQVPDQRIAWRSISGAKNSGMVNFTPLGTGRTRIVLKLNYEPEGAMEKMGDALGVMTRKVEGDLERFKEFIESRGTETGAWRGEIRGKEVKSTGQGFEAGPITGTSPTGHPGGGTAGGGATPGTAPGGNVPGGGIPPS